MEEIDVYSDGACSGNPGPGGWAVRILFPNGHIRELGGAVAKTTNNRMELQAVIEGLSALKVEMESSSVNMITDSEYVLKGITIWIIGWKNRGWKTASKKPVMNQDLWTILDELNQPKINWQYTRGHAGDPNNERCDHIAQAFAKGELPLLINT